MFGDHAAGGDHHCGVDTDVSACPDLFSGMYKCMLYVALHTLKLLIALKHRLVVPLVNSIMTLMCYSLIYH